MRFSSKSVLSSAWVQAAMDLPFGIMAFWNLRLNSYSRLKFLGKENERCNTWHCSICSSAMICIAVLFVLANGHNEVRDAQNYKFSAIQRVFFACRGLIKILSVAAVVLWYCRIRHGSVQDFRLACFEYKYLIPQKSFEFYGSFPRVQSWKNGFQAGCCHRFCLPWRYQFVVPNCGHCKLSLSDAGEMRSDLRIHKSMRSTKG